MSSDQGQHPEQAAVTGQDGIQMPAQPHFRITGRTYSGNAEPLVDVLVMLYDWSVERQRRLATENPVEPTDA